MKLIFKKLTLFLFLSLTLVSSLSLADSWGPVVQLRDDTGFFPDGKPSGGWWVTPIHATLLANGQVLITGWGRRDRDNCSMSGTRRTGTSFVLDPNTLPKWWNVKRSTYK